MAYSTSILCITIETLFFFGIIILDAVVYYKTFLQVGGFKPFHRGFFCNDHDIMKPYKTERLSFVGILTAGTILSIAAIFGIELELYFKKRENGGTSNEDRKSGKALTIPSCFIRMLHRMGVFGSGLAVMLLICQVVAIMIGRLRPHFLAVCKPNNTLYNCSDGYITADVCTGDPLQVKIARFSFPSGHTAISTYTMVFISIYLQASFCLRIYKLFRMVLQTFLILLGFAVGLSRLRDYRHHWLDVIGAALIGAFAAWLVTVYIIRIFDKKERQDPKDYRLLQPDSQVDEFQQEPAKIKE